MNTANLFFMVWAIKTLFLGLFFCSFLTGCKPKERPIWEQMKITDIPPEQYEGTSNPQMIETANFNIFIYEISEDNFEKLTELWEPLSKQDIYLLDYRAFTSNSFRAGLGRVTSFRYMNKVLQEADAALINRIVLLIPTGQSNDVEAAYLDSPQSVFYVSADGSMTGDSFGQGYLVMRLLAKRISTAQGVSNVQFGVVFRPPHSTLQALEIRRKREEYLFIPTIFNVNMGAGDLIVLSPHQLNPDGSTLDSIFFGQNDEREVFRLYIIVCTGVAF